MPESFPLKLTSKARDDIEEILFTREDYAGKRSADALERRLRKQISNLSLFPYLGRPTEIEALGDIIFRVSVVDHYLCFYVVYGDAVFVDHVLDGRTDYAARIFGENVSE